LEVVWIGIEQTLKELGERTGKSWFFLLNLIPTSFV
jgi:hypothetical protein